MQKNTNITVTITGRADISALPKCEQELLLGTLLQRITELARGGER